MATMSAYSPMDKLELERRLLWRAAQKIGDLLIDSSNQPPKKLVSSFIATVLIW